jgi:hypothetical protein
MNPLVSVKSSDTMTLAPGARVLIRDEEWLVRRVDPSSDGGQLLKCDSDSELADCQVAWALLQA